MADEGLARALASLSAAVVADACVRLGLQVRAGPPGLRPVGLSATVAGLVVPARHRGSVDVFLEAIEGAEPGDVLVADNGGLLTEGCIGDLVALEARMAGLAAIVIWGAHRDTADLLEIGLPVFSLGTAPAGPLTTRELPFAVPASARVGEVVVGPDDWAICDLDGVVFVAGAEAEAVARVGGEIRARERAQAVAAAAGRSLREQLRFDDFLAARSRRPGLSFREHLRAIGGAIEE